MRFLGREQILAFLFFLFTSAATAQEVFELSQEEVQPKTKFGTCVAIMNALHPRYGHFYFQDSRKDGEEGVVFSFQDAAARRALVSIRLVRGNFQGFPIRLERDGPWIVISHPEPHPIFKLVEVVPVDRSGRYQDTIYPRRIALLAKSPDHAKKAFDTMCYLLLNAEDLPRGDMPPWDKPLRPFPD